MQVSPRYCAAALLLFCAVMNSRHAHAIQREDAYSTFGWTEEIDLFDPATGILTGATLSAELDMQVGFTFLPLESFSQADFQIDFEAIISSPAGNLLLTGQEELSVRDFDAGFRKNFLVSSTLQNSLTSGPLSNLIGPGTSNISASWPVEIQIFISSSVDPALVFDLQQSGYTEGTVASDVRLQYHFDPPPPTEFFWANPSSSGSYLVASNWSPEGVPGAGDKANFNLDNVYTVNFGADVETAVTRVSRGDVTMNLNGHNYNVADKLIVGDTPGQSATLRIPEVDHLIANDIVVGEVDGANGLLILGPDSTSGSSLTAATFGQGGAGSAMGDDPLLIAEKVTIKPGSQVKITGGSMQITEIVSESPALPLPGPGPLPTPLVIEGSNNPNEPTLVADKIVIMSNGDAAGTVMGVSSGMVVGPGRSVVSASQVLMGGGPPTRLTSIVKDNSQLKVGSRVVPSLQGVMLLSLLEEDDVTLDVETGSSVEVSSDAATVVGQMGQATLRFSGGSSFNGAGTPITVGDGGSGEVQLSDESNMDVGMMNIGQQSGSMGMVSVMSGQGASTLAADQVNVAVEGQGTLEVLEGGVAHVACAINVSAAGNGDVMPLFGAGSNVMPLSAMESIAYGPGMLHVAGTGVVTADVITIGTNGQLIGTGTVETSAGVNFSGKIAPGSSPGTLHILGPVHQLNGGVVEIEIAGTAPGSEHDVLSIVGEAVFDGLFTFIFDGYSPQQGDTFDFLMVDGQTDLTGVSYEVRNLLPGFEFDVMLTDDGFQMVALTSGTFVPEPGALVLMSLCTIGVLSFRRSKHRWHSSPWASIRVPSRYTRYDERNTNMLTLHRGSVARKAPRVRSIGILWNSIAAVLIGSVLLGTVARVADAATYEWTNPINGFFSTGGNWTLTSGAGTPPPKTGDTALFNEAGAYTVSFSDTASSDAFSLSSGDVTFRSFGVDEVYKIQSGTADATITGGTLTVGVSGDPLNIAIADDLTVNSSGALNVLFGSDVQATDIIMGTGGASTIIVDGSGSSLNRTGTTTSVWGSSGANGSLTYRNSSSGDINGTLRVAHSSFGTSTASLDVESDADLTLDSLEVGTFGTSTATGIVTVGGSGSTITQTGASTLTLGSAAGNIGVLNVNASGTFSTGTGGITVNATGQLNLAGGTLNANGDITLDGGTFHRTSGALIKPVGWTLTASNNAQIDWMGSVYSIVQDATLIIESGADFTSNTIINIGGFSGTDGTLIVDGAGSTVTTTGSSTWPWGSGGGTGNATVRNQAQADIAGTIRLADGGAGTTGIVNVEGDGDLTIENFHVGSVSGGTATVNITGSGSTLTSSALTVGTSGSGSATIDLENGGVLNSGPSNTTVNKTGTINIGVVGTGTFNPFGDVVVNGGTINQGPGGAFNLVPGNAFTASNDAQINIDNSFSIYGGSNTTIDSGADLSVASSIFISGNLGDGVLIVDGDGSTFEAALIGNADSFWGLSGNTANITIRNNATATVGATFLAAGGHGNLHIESGGKISFESLLIAGDGSPVNGTVTITGFDSSLTITGPDTLLVGNATGGTATINVDDQGTLSTSIGGMHLDGSGVVNLNEGTVNLNGPLTASFPGSGTGTFHFNRGQLNVNDPLQTVSIGPSGQRIGSFPLSTATTLTLFTPRGLHVAGMTHVEPGGVLQLAGGSFSGGTLLLQPGGLLKSINTANSANVAIVALAGSTIDATSDLTLGDATRVNGFGSAGTLYTRANTVTLLDQNDAVFDSLALVTLGESGNAGTLIADNGLTLDFGGNIAGHGTVNTPDNAATPLVNNGHIAGNSGAEPITLTGYVKGVGTLDNVVITGTDAPGFSPATVVRGSVEYEGTLEIEIGGTGAGDFDQINHILGAGIADLGGTLAIDLINSFVPAAGDSFEILTAAGGVNGMFGDLVLPSLDSGLLWNIDYNTNDVLLSVIETFTADFDLDGDVDGGDLTVWQAAYGAGSHADADGDGDSDGRDFLEWQRQHGSGVSSLAASHAVPEPGTLALTALCLLGILHFRIARDTA